MIHVLARALRRDCIALGALALAACQVLPPAPPTVAPPAGAAAQAVYTIVPFDALPGWHADSQDAAWPALLAQCRMLLDAAPTREAWLRTCEDAARLPAPDTTAARAFFESHFTAYRIADAAGKDAGLVTGYYEPLLAGSRTRTPEFGVPLFGVPDDLLVVELADLYPELNGKRVRARLDGRRVLPYWPRADIDAGKAPHLANVIAYVADPVEAFFLEIQGSGRIALPDGAVMRVGYADQNGHPFRSIARVLIDRGELTADTASMQAIKAWGRAHRDALPALLAENPSYVFFREIPPPAPGSLDARIDGPIGTLGVPLLAQRTIAVDTRYVPLGAPVYLDTTSPQRRAPMQRLTLAQDTGGAIRGIARADFFWGFGDDAGRDAGRMRQPGRMWVLWPRDAALPTAKQP